MPRNISSQNSVKCQEQSISTVAKHVLLPPSIGIGYGVRCLLRAPLRCQLRFRSPWTTAPRASRTPSESAEAQSPASRPPSGRGQRPLRAVPPARSPRGTTARPPPRNPRHLDCVEGGRNCVSESFGAKTLEEQALDIFFGVKRIRQWSEAVSPAFTKRWRATGAGARHGALRAAAALR